MSVFAAVTSQYIKMWCFAERGLSWFPAISSQFLLCCYSKVCMFYTYTINIPKLYKTFFSSWGFMSLTDSACVTSLFVYLLHKNSLTLITILHLLQRGPSRLTKTSAPKPVQASRPEKLLIIERDKLRHVIFNDTQGHPSPLPIH